MFRAGIIPEISFLLKIIILQYLKQLILQQMQKQKCNKTSSSFGLVSSVLDWRLQCVQMIQPEYVCYVCVCGSDGAHVEGMSTCYIHVLFLLCSDLSVPSSTTTYKLIISPGIFRLPSWKFETCLYSKIEPTS